jgi:hypothetical protein
MKTENPKKSPEPKADFAAIVSEAKEKAEKRCIELEAIHKKKVYPLVFVREATQQIFVGFIAEPKRAAKMEALDIMSSKNSVSLAGEAILNTSLIKEESHEAFSLIEDPRYDDVYIGGCIDSLAHVNVLINSLKKK